MSDVTVLNFNELIGDTIKEKFGSMAIELIKKMQEMNGHDDCYIICNNLSANMLNVDFKFSEIDTELFYEYPKDLFYIGDMHYTSSPVFIDELMANGQFSITKTVGFNPIEKITKIIEFTNLL